MTKTLSLSFGQVTGETITISDSEVTAYLGIPYARSERFGLPVMLDHYDANPINYGRGVRFPQSDVPPLLNFFMKNPMMRPEILTNKDETREDAHVLNIWTAGAEEKKPVLVFIHGGGFTYGSGTTPLYNGKYIASQGFVVVTINYRLGIPGFLPVMKDGKISANRGFYDQQCALKWIRAHIAEFGGDEGNITLMGQSAGGMSAFTQYLNAESGTYFDKLIVCSAGAPKCVTLERAEEIWDSFAKVNHVNDISDLETLPYKKLLRMKLPLEVASSPVLDGILLSENAIDLLKSGRFPVKPVLVGSDGDEMRMIANKSWYKALHIAVTEEAFQEKCRTLYGEQGTRLAEAIRPEARDLPDLQFKLVEIPMFHASVLQELELMSVKTPIYGYRSEYVPNAWNGLRGAYHCSELPFIFGTLQDMDYKATPENLQQMKLMQADFLGFVKSGGVPGAEPFDKENRITLYRGTEKEQIDFPHRDLIREISESDLFDRLQKDFMRGRDENFIA